MVFARNIRTGIEIGPSTVTVAQVQVTACAPARRRRRPGRSRTNPPRAIAASSTDWPQARLPARERRVRFVGGKSEAILVDSERGSVRVEATAKSLQNALSSIGARRVKEATVVIDDPSLCFRSLSLPKGPGENMDADIRVYAEQYLPYPSAQATVDYKVIPSLAADRLEIMIIAVKRVVTEEVVSIAALAGVRVKRIDVVPFAVHRVFRANYGTAPGEVVALLRSSQDRAYVAIVRGSEIAMLRHFVVGQEDSEQEMARQLEGTFLAFEDRHPEEVVQKLCLCGGALGNSSTTPTKLEGYLRDYLGVTVFKLDPFGRTAMEKERRNTRQDEESCRENLFPAIGAAI